MQEKIRGFVAEGNADSPAVSKHLAVCSLFVMWPNCRIGANRRYARNRKSRKILFLGSFKASPHNRTGGAVASEHKHAH